MIKNTFKYILFFLMSNLMAVESTNTIKYNGFEMTASGSHDQLHFNIPEYELNQVSQDGIQYLKPEINGAGTVAEPGEPFLPTITTFYAIQPGKNYSASIEILESETLENIDILPFDTWENDPINNLVKGPSYDQAGAFPENIIEISDPIIMRGLAMVQVSLTPFQYNPITKNLTIIQNAEINLIETESTNVPFIPSKRSRAFEPLYESMAVNYGTLSRDNIDYQRPAILYVLPNNIGNLFSTIESLMEWKKRVGYDVSFVSSSNIVNNRNNLKDYIEEAYETWDNPPVYVTIVGDASGSYDIPAWSDNWSGYNGDTDHPYTTLEGDDQYPEVFIGRISFSTSSHLQTIVSKTLNYESNPYMNENWFQRACLVGDPTTSGISCVISNENINEMLDIAGFEEVNTVYEGSFPSQMTSGISDGVSFFNYRGYYGVSGFGGGDVNNTSNGFMLPVATVITCGTGSYASGESLTEEFIRAGTSSNPKGSVACIGTATLGTHTMFNNIVDMGFYYGALIEDIESAGGALMYGKMMLYKNYPSNPNNWCHIFSAWNNLMGEASLQMWTSYPEMTSVLHPFAVSVGSNYIDIVVDKESGAVEDAWVTIYMGNEIFESGYTNSEGFIRLPINSTQIGEVLVTVTKRNHYPYQSSFQIYDPGVSINLAETPFVIDDDEFGNSIGNGDMIANGGETIELSVNVTNYGSEDASNIIAIVSSESSNLEIQTSEINIGDIASGETVASNDPFIITLLDGLSEGADLELMINFSDDQNSEYTGWLDIAVSGSHLRASSIDVLGSNDNILEPGETSYIKINLDNIGSSDANYIQGTITCASPFIEILDDSGSWTSVVNGGSSFNEDDYFELSALEETIPGAIAHLIVNVETENGYQSNSIVEIQIGEADVNDPVGPDSYGYYIYDNQDLDYILAPTYNWIEIDDREGGPGSHLSSLSDSGNNQDDVETIDLPFNFRFYGQEYNQISISSNGWIAMGESELESFRNYELPGVGGPSKMIAVFWDDLKTSNGGRVYTWYDQSEKKFYVEWSGVRTYQNNTPETFQAILLDPDYYVTPTGDGDIILQYKEFNNDSYGAYSWDQIHGNYCTVGIEDHTMERGLQYTFNDTYHNAAMELGDETALLITTRGSDLRLDGDLNYDEKVDIYDLMLLADYNLGIEGQVNPFFGDINEDGMVNVMDLISLIGSIMGYDI